MDSVRAHLIISGEVQGVFYRDSMRGVAYRHGVVGWVRNLFDGRVEAVLEGPRGAVEAVIDWSKQGPPAAEVEDVAVQWEEYGGEFHTFEVRR